MWPPPLYGQGVGGPNGQIVSVKRAADGRRQRIRKIIDKEREKYRANNGSLRNTSTDSKGTTFVILKNHTSVPIRNERWSLTSKANREASRNEFMEKGGMPDRVKSFQEINSRKNCPKIGLGLLNPSEMDRDRYRIWSSVDRPGRKLAWRGERMELDSGKKSRRDRMMRSNSFDTKEVREIGWKEAGESRGFSILWMGIIEDVFQMEGKECKDQERLKM